MFITFEGSEGCGKTTQMALLAEYLAQQGLPSVTTREPGGTPIGEQVRAILSDLENTAMHPRTEILLFQASRAQHVEQIIRPHLAQGDIILCDRYADSTMAYQGYGYQLVALDVLSDIVDFATGGLKPDLTLLLDLEVEEGLRRRAQGGEWNRLDAYQLDFYQRVRRGYHEMARAEPRRWVIIDANHTPGRVQADIRRVVLDRLRLAGKQAKK
jgi:dTMP kinase